MYAGTLDKVENEKKNPWNFSNNKENQKRINLQGGREKKLIVLTRFNCAKIKWK